MDNHDRFWLAGHGRPPPPCPILGGPWRPHGPCASKGSRRPRLVSKLYFLHAPGHIREIQRQETPAAEHGYDHLDAIDLGPEDIEEDCHTGGVTYGKGNAQLLRIDSNTLNT